MSSPPPPDKPSKVKEIGPIGAGFRRASLQAKFSKTYVAGASAQVATSNDTNPVSRGDMTHTHTHMRANQNLQMLILVSDGHGPWLLTTRCLMVAKACNMIGSLRKSVCHCLAL